MAKVIDFTKYKETGKIAEFEIQNQKDKVEVEVIGYLGYDDNFGIPGYKWIKMQDAERCKNCKHLRWEIVVDNYSARCIKCDVIAYTAPW